MIFAVLIGIYWAMAAGFLGGICLADNREMSRRMRIAATVVQTVFAGIIVPLGVSIGLGLAIDEIHKDRIKGGKS